MAESITEDTQSFDFVIIGGGSAGSAVARRLSDNARHKVLLLEAGQDDRWIWLKVPLGAGKVVLQDRAMWRFYTEPEPHMDNRRMYWPRGRVLGGSSQINLHGLVASNGHVHDAALARLAALFPAR